MKSLLTAMLVTILCGTTAFAFDVEHYVRLGAGAALRHDTEITGKEAGTAKFKTGYCVEGAFGFKFNWSRVELAVGYQHNDGHKFESDDGQVWHQGDGGYKEYTSIQPNMVNGYLEGNWKSFRPYAMAGLGIANVEWKKTYEGHDFNAIADWVFAWQVGLGIGMQITEHFVLDLGYRYLATSDVKGFIVEGTTDNAFTVATSNILFSVLYQF